MALNPSITASLTCLPWQATCAATAPILGVLQASLAQPGLLPTSAPTSPSHSPAHSAAVSHQQPLAAGIRRAPAAGTWHATAAGIRHGLAAALAPLPNPCQLPNSCQLPNRQQAGVKQWPHPSWHRQQPHWGWAAPGVRCFSATPLPNKVEAPPPGVATPPGSPHGSPPGSPGQLHAGERKEQHRIQNAMHVVQHGNVLTLREMLSDKAETNFHITYDELLELCKESGAAHSHSEAEELAEALSRSGVVMRYRNIVYLRPKEVAEMVLKALPDTELEAVERVREIDEQLSTMKAQIEDLERAANRRTRVILWGGCGLLALQLFAFVRLTWWELSWDVMEPFAYIISLCNTLVAYIYFMVFRTNLDYAPFEDYWKRRTKSQAALEQRVDLQRYDELLRLRTRYVQHMQAIASDLKRVPQVAAAAQA